MSCVDTPMSLLRPRQTMAGALAVWRSWLWARTASAAGSWSRCMAAWQGEGTGLVAHRCSAVGASCSDHSGAGQGQKTGPTSSSGEGGGGARFPGVLFCDCITFPGCAPTVKGW